MKKEKKQFYRVSNIESEQGLWYTFQGEFTGLIHNEFNFCMNSQLQMPYDENIVGWLSATSTLNELFNWFSQEDINNLKEHGYSVSLYEATDYKMHGNHWVIDQKTSKLVELLNI